jgi:hypothetical protein
VEECTHFDKTEQRHLLKLLQKFEDLFDGTLGTWKTDPVDLELIDPKVKPTVSERLPNIFKIWKIKAIFSTFSVKQGIFDRFLVI